MAKLLRLALVLIMAVSVSALLERDTAAESYRCGTASGSTLHCYGVAVWTADGEPTPEFYGVYVDIVQVRMACPQGCGGFIDNETWLTDKQTAACLRNQFQACWVEAGTIATEGGERMYFWADVRPVDKNTLNVHVFDYAESPGPINHFMIIKDDRESGIFQVWVYNDSLSVLYNAQSTNNSMIANLHTIGQELAGSQNASADGAAYTRAIWAVQPLKTDYIFWYRTHSSEGGRQADFPPMAKWIVPPTAPPPEGGEFNTRCCQ